MNLGINQVHKQVYIANIQEARTCDKAPFDAIITVCQDSIEDNVPDPYHHFNMADGPHCGYGGDYSYGTFSDAAAVLLTYLQGGKVVLIHCHAGQSRSASVAIAALSVLEGVSYEEMYSCVKESRPQIHPDGLLRRHAKRFIEER